MTMLSSGIDTSNGKAWIQIGWVPSLQDADNDVSAKRKSTGKQRIAVNRYRITWHHRPSHSDPNEAEDEEDNAKSFGQEFRKMVHKVKLISARLPFCKIFLYSTKLLSQSTTLTQARSTPSTSNLSAEMAKTNYDLRK